MLSTKNTILCVVIILTIVSVFGYLLFSNKLNIFRIQLASNVYEISNKTLKFSIKDLKINNYNILLNLFSNKSTDTTILLDMIKKSSITTEIYDIGKKTTETNTINEFSQLQSSTTKECITIKLISFNPIRHSKYNINIHFDEVDKTINNVKKEFVIEQSYDYASFPWWGLFQRIFLIFSIIGILLSLAMSFLVFRNRH